MLTLVKYSKGVTDTIKKFNKTADELYSKTVSTVRQPIEGFFNWLIEKSDIQNASKVRSTKGLNLHLFVDFHGCFHWTYFLTFDSHT